ncbi:MAG: cysteine desulfurase [Bacteroidaceae bacterium]|nr:cysteine desulfurase [Bacteroidaceae bacterium]
MNETIRADFPILSRQVYGRPLVYLDNAATTQKPRVVVEAITDQYYNTNANVHRGVHFLSQQATELHEAARECVRSFIGAQQASEIVFTRGTTESINLLAESAGAAFMREGDELIISQMEHHSNIVPWQLLRERRGIVIKVCPITDDGLLDLEALSQLLNERTRIVSICHVSNVLGTVNPIRQIADMVHAHGALLVVDAAQSVPHRVVNVQEMDCDFLAFSGHKAYGPTGIGVLYGRETLLDQMPPYQGGGEMIQRVTFERTTYQQPPYKFEAGTPDYVGSHALAIALDYMQQTSLEAIARHEHDLTRYAIERLSAIDGLHIFGQAAARDAVVSFTIQGIHPLDLGTLLDRLGIAIRTGHHCAYPLMQRYGVESMARASFALYNTREEIDALAEGIQRVKKMF